MKVDLRSTGQAVKATVNPVVTVTARIAGTPSSGGGGGADEVWIGPSTPADPGLELWFDTDAPSPVLPPGPQGPQGPPGPPGPTGQDGTWWFVDHGPPSPLEGG